MMSEQETTEYTLVLEPIPPETVTTIRRQLEEVIREELREAGQGDLLEQGAIRVEVAENFPVDPTIVAAIITVTGQFALETYKELVLPVIKKKYFVKKETKKKKKAKKDG